jgi:hypothetical protein
VCLPEIILQVQKTLAVAIALGACLLAACGGGSESANPSPTPDFTAAAEAAAPQAVLMVEDFPQFWTIAVGEGPAGRVDLEPDCDIFDATVTFPDAVVTERGEGFQGPDERRAGSAVAIFETDARAEDALDAVEATAERCRPALLAAMEEAAREEANARGFDLGIFADVDTDIDDHDFASLGDATLAYRAYVSIGVIGITAEFTLDVVLIQEGKTVGALLYSNFGELDEEEELEIAETFAGKLSAADAALP